MCTNALCMGRGQCMCVCVYTRRGVFCLVISTIYNLCACEWSRSAITKIDAVCLMRCIVKFIACFTQMQIHAALHTKSAMWSQY